MRICKTIPSSRAYFRARPSYFDVAVAVAAPPLSLWLRQTPISDADFLYIGGLYCAFAALSSVGALMLFGLQDGLKRYFSVHDALDVVKAVIFTELLICIALFSVTRLEGIPRSTILIHGLLLAGGLMSIRAFGRLYEWGLNPDTREMHANAGNIIIIGSNEQSALFIKLVGASASLQRVVGALDVSPSAVGRAIAGVPILGEPDDLPTVIDEFAVHGVEVDRVVVAGGEDLLSKPAFQELEQVCITREIRLQFLSQMLGLEPVRATQRELTVASGEHAFPQIAVPGYLRVRRVFDFFAAAVGIVLLFPLILCVAGLVLLDVGSPVLFWQQRMGRGGRPFLVYKFRTLLAPFDQNGWSTPEHRRQSAIGLMLRKTGLDELPQLLNVLIGDMALIGPRPLLPHDQPPNPAVRLLVRPGITGWAQVNGAKELTPLEKDRLDEWYIRNASLRVDLRIVYLTLKYVLTGERRSLADLLGDAPKKPSPIRQPHDRPKAGRRVA
jgi:lipopolysaccharide/colanic/teichoic acid biosynthesis glycosyltransferase